MGTFYSKRKIRDRFFGHEGFSLVESLVAAGLVTVALIASMSFLGYRQTLQKKLAEGTPETAVTNNLRSVLENKTAWANTLKDSNNTVFSCFKYTSEDCKSMTDDTKSQCEEIARQSCRDQSGELAVVRNALNQEYFKPASMRFTVDGKTCNPDSPPPEGCPISAKIAVQFICPEPDDLKSEVVMNCKSPTILLKASFATVESDISFDKMAASFFLKKWSAGADLEALSL